MKFTPLSLAGAYIIEIDPVRDERGYFARTWCRDEFKKRGLIAEIVQCNVSFNPRRGTLRGMHYQVAPHEESKVIRCRKGAIYDVILDLRPASHTYGWWVAAELSGEEPKALYVPPGFAHGFQTLLDGTEVDYFMGESFHSESARGVRWNDPQFRIDWPDPGGAILSERDRSYPDYPVARK
ncbi:MAG: dTDP-4-dehydrorhamnose 3,5-epimerase [Gemmatimonadaceae bacterium]